MLDSSNHRPLDSPKYRSPESPRTNPQSLEIKMEVLVENFNMKMENHIQDGYKKMKERLDQRILVAEQIHAGVKEPTHLKAQVDR